jgi:hypothetical protein
MHIAQPSLLQALRDPSAVKTFDRARLSLVTLYRVHEDHDKNEGRGGTTVRYTVTSEADAKTLAAGLGPMGTAGYIDKSEYLRIELSGGFVLHVQLSSVHEGDVPDTARAALAAAALRKLSPEERAALGLTPR